MLLYFDIFSLCCLHIARRNLRGWFPLINEHRQITWWVFLQVRLRFQTLQVESPHYGAAGYSGSGRSGVVVDSSVGAGAGAGGAGGVGGVSTEGYSYGGTGAGRLGLTSSSTFGGAGTVAGSGTGSGTGTGTGSGTGAGDSTALHPTQPPLSPYTPGDVHAGAVRGSSNTSGVRQSNLGIAGDAATNKSERSTDGLRIVTGVSVHDVGTGAASVSVPVAVPRPSSTGSTISNSNSSGSGLFGDAVQSVWSAFSFSLSSPSASPSAPASASASSFGSSASSVSAGTTPTTTATAGTGNPDAHNSTAGRSAAGNRSSVLGFSLRPPPTQSSAHIIREMDDFYD
jgi:hypothetical protein